MEKRAVADAVWRAGHVGLSRRIRTGDFPGCADRPRRLDHRYAALGGGVVVLARSRACADRPPMVRLRPRSGGRADRIRLVAQDGACAALGLWAAHSWNALFGDGDFAAEAQ